MLPTLSIIIVNWNVRDYLRTCLYSLQRAGSGAPRHEIIVVDNASVDGSVEMVSADFPEVRLIASGDNLGFARGCERGYLDAHGEIILLLNPDTVVIDDAIECMVEMFAADPKLGIVGSRLLNGDGSFQRATGGAFPTLRNLAWNYLLLNRVAPRAWAPAPLYLETPPLALEAIDWVSGASLMFRRSAVGATIFDPEIFMFGEDMELCDRVRRDGWKVRVSGATEIVHHHGKSFAKANAADVLASVYKGPRIFFRRHRGRVAGIAYDLILFIGYLVRWPAYGIAEALLPARGYGELARFSRRYLGVMLRDAVGLRSASSTGPRAASENSRSSP